MDRRVINGFMLVALLLVVPSFPDAQSVPTLETLRLNGPVRSLSSETLTYSYINGDREMHSRRRGLDYDFDRRGLVVSEVSYDSYNFGNRRRAFEFDASKRIVSINSFDRNEVLSDSEDYTYDSEGGYTRTSYDVEYPARRLLESVTVYDGDGLIVRQTTYTAVRNSQERRVRSTTKVERSSEGTTYSYSAGSRFESFVVDARGAPKSDYYRDGSRTVSMQYSYDSKGLLSRVEEYDSTTRRKSSWEVSYTPQGQATEISHLDYLDRLVSKVNMDYESGHLSSKQSVHYDADQKPLFTWLYHYDSEGNEIGKSLSFASFPDRFVWKTRYSGGKMIEQTVTNGSGRLLEGYQGSYDSRGLLTRRVQLGRNGVVRSTLDQVLRSEKEVESYTSTDAFGVTDKHYTNAYDEKGKLLRAVTYNSDISVLSIKEYRYQYDRFGNWTHMEVYESNNPQEYYERLIQSTTRNISYY